ncbi:hypothetical protein [Acidovorax sp. NCPPB 3576]|uniref:hypothetical protein n=1 Tax=Acidovorax sp. NCPPB 3576 TaxID=2940488 RepID=UPI00234A96D0|nr:hypothetical protein [Acidovorax sp. NCPPB 3576]WCM88654.1 hypothetical protein M5C98_00915 [Acidovorax sp. NCPPB 3576]
MNAPLPEPIRRAIETVTLDDNPHCWLRHRGATGGAAERCVFGVERAGKGDVL